MFSFICIRRIAAAHTQIIRYVLLNKCRKAAGIASVLQVIRLQLGSEAYLFAKDDNSAATHQRMSVATPRVPR